MACQERRGRTAALEPSHRAFATIAKSATTSPKNRLRRHVRTATGSGGPGTGDRDLRLRSQRSTIADCQVLPAMVVMVTPSGRGCNVRSCRCRSGYAHATVSDGRVIVASFRRRKRSAMAGRGPNSLDGFPLGCLVQRTYVQRVVGLGRMGFVRLVQHPELLIGQPDPSAGSTSHRLGQWRPQPHHDTPGQVFAVHDHRLGGRNIDDHDLDCRCEEVVGDRAGVEHAKTLLAPTFLALPRGGRAGENQLSHIIDVDQRAPWTRERQPATGRALAHGRWATQHQRGSDLHGSTVPGPGAPRHA